MFSSRRKHDAFERSGFTLVELLVVITIIGILVGMLLPAVNSARESGRKLQCANNLKQMATAMLAHEQAQEIFPTGGWGWYWVGDPDRGCGTNQPGGWFYNILPHLEQSNLHDLGHYAAAAAKKSAMIQMVRTPQPIMNCPTRRRSVLYQSANGTYISQYGGGVSNTPDTTQARGDYAVNVGDTNSVEWWAGPSDPGATAITAPWHYPSSLGDPNSTSGSGISFECSTVRQQDVTDGCTNTIMLAEKFVGPDHYGSGADAADNENIYVGQDNDVYRGTGSPPIQDRWGVYSYVQFGSAHFTSANFAFCDGSVHTINYAVDMTTYHNLGNRHDGNAVDLSKL